MKKILAKKNKRTGIKNHRSNKKKISFVEAIRLIK